jgi:hypothetical protein
MNLLDIITELNRELRFNASFRALLQDCDEQTRQRVTQHYSFTRKSERQRVRETPK